MPSFKSAHLSLDRERHFQHKSGNKTSNVSGSFVQQAGNDIVLASGEDTNLNSGRGLRTNSANLDMHARKKLSLTSEESSIIDSFGAIRIGNKNCKIILTESGDMKLIAHGEITINGKKINLN